MGKPLRTVGIDPGQRRVGIAVSDEAEGRVALPWSTVERGPDNDEAARRVAAEMVDFTVHDLVVGLPLRLDGTEGPAARRARVFGDRLGRLLNVKVNYWDERLTTLGAERSLRGLGLSARKQKRVVDQAAAAILLQSYLDAARERSVDGE